MLSQLSIHNFGLIEQLTIEFSHGLNVLTGSTGAGKSIIIDGLRFALGGRLKSSQIRDSSKPCIVELVFELRDTGLRSLPPFSEFLSDGDNNLIISRQASPDGRGKIKINGFNVTVAQLRNIGNHLMDFHGPHDHQLLLSEEYHIRILDQLTEFKGLKDEYKSKTSH